MVVELYDTERSYVEALQILVNVSTFIARLTEKQISDQRIFRKTDSSLLTFLLDRENLFRNPFGDT